MNGFIEKIAPIAFFVFIIVILILVKFNNKRLGNHHGKNKHGGGEPEKIWDIFEIIAIVFFIISVSLIILGAGSVI
jgi:heme/copper-type cytochrome/quinol oxidase subunit 2